MITERPTEDAATEEWRDRNQVRDRAAGELRPQELLRWFWRQLTSMRTALVLLLLLALGAVPGSVIPQQGVDALKTQRWQEQHTTLTPIYEKLSLFAVYHSPWFSAIYLLLMVSLMGCIIPRLFVYWGNFRATPPAAPRNLSRLPDHASYTTQTAPEEVLDRAEKILGHRHRISTSSIDERTGGWVSAERGHWREAGNLLFHLAVLVVLVGFGVGSLFGYKGGVILVVGKGFSNNLANYDDFDPGSLFNADQMEPFCFKVHDFKVQWLDSGPRQGLARGFQAPLTYRASCRGDRSNWSAAENYDLRVNHPLTIGGTQIFLIGHGYAPVITVRDASGTKVAGGPTVFLPESSDFLSFGVVKAADAKPSGIGLDGLFYPTYAFVNGNPINVMGQVKNPTISMLAYAGDLNMDQGQSQSIYALDTSKATLLKRANGKMFRVDLQLHQTVKLPGGAGTVSFDGVRQWTRVQISRTPFAWVTLLGVVLALIGLLGSLFIRPRRVWVRARTVDGETLVEIAALDRSGGGDLAAVLSEVETDLRSDDAAGSTSDMKEMA